MQYKSILLAFAATATALPSFQSVQDLPTLKGAAEAIASALTTFDTAVKALGPTSDPATAVPDLTTKQAAILTALKDSTAKIIATTPITLTEALQLTPATNALSQAANTTINDLIVKKPIFDKSGQTPKVLATMQEQLTVTKAFSEALVAKLPPAVKAVGNAQSKVATDALVVSLSFFLRRCKN